MWGYDHWNGFGLLLGFIINILFWVVIVSGIVHLAGCSKCTGRGKDTPLDILKRRYAAGEINAEEFAQKKKDLQTF